MVDYTYVTEMKSLIDACNEMKKHGEVGIDLECENNLHHYGSYISLIQISTKEKHYIIDVMQMKDIKPLTDLIQNPNIQKIFHDVSFDLRILNHQFKCRPKNIFDTQLAALFAGKKEIGLGPLLEHYFKVKKEHKHQMADWTRRPIRNDMLEYAIKDTLYLIRLRDILKDELKKKGRISWIEEEFKEIENTNFEYNEGDYTSFKGFRMLTDSQRAILKRLFTVRDQLAMKVNRPVFFVIGNRQMMGIVEKPPRSIEEWRHMKGVHPIIRLKADLLFDAVEKGKRERIVIEPIRKKRFNPEQQDKFRRLALIRDSLSEELQLQKHLILDKDQMQDIVLKGDWNVLKKWQKVLIDKNLKR